MKVEEENGLYFWTGEVDGKEQTVKGSQCHAIQPDIIEREGSFKFGFDKQFILDLNVSISLRSKPSTSTTNLEADCVSCFICKKQVKLVDMRQHVGKHILVGNVEGQNLCGFCGRETCSNEFFKKSWKSKEAFYEIKSNCPYFVKMKKSDKNHSRRNPCSNNLILCQICKASVGKYN